MSTFKAYLLSERVIVKKNIIRISILIIITMLLFVYTQSSKYSFQYSLISTSAFIGSIYANFSTLYEFDEKMDNIIFSKFISVYPFNAIKVITAYLISFSSFLLYILILLMCSYTTISIYILTKCAVVLFIIIFSNTIALISINIIIKNKILNFIVRVIVSFLFIIGNLYIYITTSHIAFFIISILINFFLVFFNKHIIRHKYLRIRYD